MKKLSSVIATPTNEQYDYVISANSLQTILDTETITRFDSLIELLLAFAVGVIVLICRYYTTYCSCVDIKCSEP